MHGAVGSLSVWGQVMERERRVGSKKEQMFLFLSILFMMPML